MTRWAAILVVVTLAASGGAEDVSAPTSLQSPWPATTQAATQPAKITFVPVDVFIDPQGKALACYQVEIVTTTGQARLVGVEGGENASFSDAPYYDPRALQNGRRIVLGAYTLGGDLPTGKTRVARLMFEVVGAVEPHYQATLHVAASSDEKPIAAVVSLAAHSTSPRVGMETSTFNGDIR